MLDASRSDARTERVNKDGTNCVSLAKARDTKALAHFFLYKKNSILKFINFLSKKFTNIEYYSIFNLNFKNLFASLRDATASWVGWIANASMLFWHREAMGATR